MRYHLDTSFLIDWNREDKRIAALSDEIISGIHDVSIDPIVETEYFAALRVDRRKQAIFDRVLVIGRSIALSTEICQLSARWLAPMDERQRLAHFADALIGAVAVVENATLVTGDARLARVFPGVAVRTY